MMKFKLERHTTMIPTYRLKDGWWVLNDAEGYLDVEHSMVDPIYEVDQFNSSLGKHEQESSAFDMRVTFIRHATLDDEFTGAHITFQLNRPDGNHVGWDGHINVSIEEALRLCCEPRS